MTCLCSAAAAASNRASRTTPTPHAHHPRAHGADQPASLAMANEKKVDTELLLSMSLDDIIAANAKKAGGKPAGKPKQQAVGGDAGSARSSWLSEPAPCRREPATALSVERMSSPRAPATRRACLPRSCDLGPITHPQCPVALAARQGRRQEGRRRWRQGGPPCQHAPVSRAACPRLGLLRCTASVQLAPALQHLLTAPTRCRCCRRRLFWPRRRPSSAPWARRR